MSRAMKDSGVPWIGSIPENWETASLRTLFHQRKSQNSDGREKNLLSLSYGNIIQKDINSSFGLLPENFNSYNVVESGDIVLRLTDLQNDQRSLRTGLVRMRGIITSAYVTISPSIRVCERYFHLLLHAADICKLFYNLGNGVRQNLQFKDLRMLPLIQPSLEEQQRIADFLNAKAQEVDAAIEKTRESIEEYQKLKQSVITQTLTKGIRPGTIFKKTTLGKISVEIQTGPFGSQLHQSDYTKEGIPVVMPKNLVGGIICDVDIARVNMAFVERLAQHKITKGNLLYSRRGEVGRCALASEVNEGWLCGTGCLRVRLNEQVAYPKYVMYQAAEASTMTWIQFHAVGTTMLNINSSILQSVPIEIPAFPEQQEIVAYLDEKCGAIDALIEKKRQIITELESYKKSLIYEYVTGKKEVPA